MFKTKLLILLLIKLSLISCTQNDYENNNLKFSLGYISGEYEGLLLKNYLTSHLESFKMLDKKSNLEVRASIDHGASLYVTNIDNTSNRRRVVSDINIQVFNKNLKCSGYNDTEQVTQFYIFAPNDKFISNNQALQKIMSENTEELVKRIVNKLMYVKVGCKKHLNKLQKFNFKYRGTI